MTPRPGRRVAALLVLALVVGSTRSADASHLRYVFRGKVASLLESTMAEDREPDVIEAAGATFRAGDPFEMVLQLPAMEPTDSHRWEYWDPEGRVRELGNYTVPGRTSWFSVEVGGHTYGGSNGSQPMYLGVEDDTAGDAFFGYQIFEGDRPGLSDAWVELQLRGSSDAILDGVGLPTDLDAGDFAAEGDSRAMILRLSGLDADLMQSVIGEIDSIEVTTLDDASTVALPAEVGEPVPIPEPGMLSMFVGMGLAALSWRRLRPGRGRAAAGG